MAGDSLLSDGPTCSCDDNQVCLRVGRFGDPKCVDCEFLCLIATGIVCAVAATLYYHALIP